MNSSNTVPKFNYPDLLGYQIIKAEVFIKRKLNSLFLSQGQKISFEQWTVLNVLYNSPGVTQSDIAYRTYKDKTNITRILEVLERRRLVRRDSDSSDKRVFRVSLTIEGETMMNGLAPSIVKFNEELQNGITEPDLLTFMSVLRQVHKNSE